MQSIDNIPDFISCSMYSNASSNMDVLSGVFPSHVKGEMPSRNIKQGHKQETRTMRGAQNVLGTLKSSNHSGTIVSSSQEQGNNGSTAFMGNRNDFTKRMFLVTLLMIACAFLYPAIGSIVEGPAQLLIFGGSLLLSVTFSYLILKPLNVDMESRSEAGNTSGRDENAERFEAYKRQHDKMFAEMLTNVSHEIRTPLSSLMLTAECVADGVYDPTPDTMMSISEQVRKIDETFTAIKDYASTMTAFDFDSETVAWESFQMVYQNTKAYHLNELEVSIAIDEQVRSARTRGTSQALFVLFDSIFDNIQRHAIGAKAIELTCDLQILESRQYVCFSIADDGQGTDADFSQLVMPFWKQDASHTTAGREYSDVSLGLGLALANDIVQASDGIMSIDSSQGNGMTVNIKLPVVSWEHN